MTKLALVEEAPEDHKKETSGQSGDKLSGFEELLEYLKENEDEMAIDEPIDLSGFAEIINDR